MHDPPASPLDGLFRAGCCALRKPLHFRDVADPALDRLRRLLGRRSCGPARLGRAVHVDQGHCRRHDDEKRYAADDQNGMIDQLPNGEAISHLEVRVTQIIEIASCRDETHCESCELRCGWRTLDEQAEYRAYQRPSDPDPWLGHPWEGCREREDAL